MSDIFREVEEDVRRERFVKLWKAYGDYVIAAGAVMLVAIAVFELWQRYEASERAKASAAFIAAQNITVPGAAEPIFAKLAQTAPGGYRLLARLEQADTLFAGGKPGPAINLYKAIAKDDNGPIGAVARLRAAWALADTAGKDDLQTLLAPLTDPSSPWSQTAREVLAYADYHASDFRAALTEYASLASDPQAPDALRQRARAMAAYLESGGETNFGTVPPPPPPAAPAGAATDAPSPGAADAAKP